MAIQLSLLPTALVLLAFRPRLLLTALLGSCLLAEYGRQRGDGARVFPVVASLMAPLWLGERAVCSWLALLSRARFGGVRYHGAIVSKAATPPEELRARFRHLNAGGLG